MNISSLIKKSGKTRQQIIEEVGCSQSLLSLVETGQRQIGPKFLAKMARSLGVSPSSLRPDLATLLQEGGPDRLQAVNSGAGIQGPDAKNSQKHTVSAGAA